MKFLVAFSCLIAVASAVPATILAPAAVTYQSQKQSLVPIGTQVHTTVAHGPTTIIKSAPLAVAPVVSHLSAPLVAPLAAPLGVAPLGLGHGSLVAPLASPYGLAKTWAAPALLGGPLLH